jgi:hypothetical protein
MLDIELHQDDEILSRPSWEQIEARIRDLVGSQPHQYHPDNTIVLCAQDEELPSMVVARHVDGSFWVRVDPDYGIAHMLVDRTRGEQLVETNVPFGQREWWPARYFVGVESVVHAAQRFCAIGNVDDSLAWEQVENRPRRTR